MPPPEIPNRDHQWSEIDSPLFDSMSEQFLTALERQTVPQAGCFDFLPSLMLKAMESETERIVGYPVEHLVFFDDDGNVVEEVEGSDDMVRFEFGPGVFRKACVHNHPKGSPPSKQDVFLMAAYAIPLVRVVTNSGFLFDIGPGNEKSFSTLKLEYERLDSVSWGVAEDCIRARGLIFSEEERFFRRQHALLYELAQRGLLCYGHRKWRT